jgi:hypothetical protein
MPLRPCRECGKEISSEAPNCPQCGAPPARIGFANKQTIIVGCSAGLAGAIFATVLGSVFNSSGGNKAIEGLRGKQSECQETVRKLQAQGAADIFDYNGYTVAAYPRSNWEALKHDEKVRQALLIFCAKMPADGHYTVLIKDRDSGRDLSSVLDGKYIEGLHP